MLTSGQKDSLDQLREIERSDPAALSIESVHEPSEECPWLCIEISLLIGPVPKADGGIRLHERESFCLFVPKSFPFNHPEVYSPHHRFAGMPHVQWKRRLCLYQSRTEWNPSDGMYGFMERLDFWLKQGAINQLDPEGQPLHPPAVYADFEYGKLVIPRVDTPDFSGDWWLGLASIRNLPNRIEIVGWDGEQSFTLEKTFALALLFSRSFPWEYPTDADALFRACEVAGVPEENLMKLLRLASMVSGEGRPIYFILGSPMRGIAGGPRKQHLSVWAIDATIANEIRSGVQGDGGDNRITLVREWLRGADVSWCPVREDRPEIVTRRDHLASVSAFRTKEVSIWGCGALGAHLALYLCRAGVSRLVLRDFGTVTPGILVRQPFREDDLGTSKVEALKKILLEIRPEVLIETSDSDIPRSLFIPGKHWSQGADIMIDATASASVRYQFEGILNRRKGGRVPRGFIMIDGEARFLAAGYCGADYSGGAWDLLRKSKIEMSKDRTVQDFFESFFPDTESGRPFQPEPGCSEPTFVGSATDVAGLAAIGLNLIASSVGSISPSSGVVHFFRHPTATWTSSGTSAHRFEYSWDFLFSVGEYEIRFSPSALRSMKAWIAQNRRVRHSRVETGGLLWGEWDDAIRVIWITEASGPPPDSSHAASLFECGLEGTKSQHEVFVNRTRGSVGYIGMWHTHPVSRPLPSSIDVEGMCQILTNGPLPPRRNLLAIIGKQSMNDALGLFLFRRRVSETLRDEAEVSGTVTELPAGLL